MLQLTAIDNLAMGVIESKNNPASFLYRVVLLVGIVGAVLARFQSRSMARALIATPSAQVLIAVVAIVAGLGFTAPATVLVTAM